MSQENSELSKSNVANAASILKAFSKAEISGNDIILNDIYIVNNSDNNIRFSLVFHNIGVATTTDALLDNVKKAVKKHGSIINFPIESNKQADGKFLKIFSAVAATSQTPLPADLVVDFSISGGVNSISYPVPSFKLSTTNDTVNIDISIFFIHI